MRMWELSALCMSCALTGCAGNGEGLDANGRPDDGGVAALQPTFQSIQDNVFTPVCTGCHAGAAAPLGLRLDEGFSYALLVNASSVEVPSLHRVEPGNPEASYLIDKLEGTATQGSRMPLNGTPLPQATIDVIRQWIMAGAENTAAASSGKPTARSAALTAIAPVNGDIVPAAVREIIVAANVSLDTSLLQSDLITLRASGGDGEFVAGNEIDVPVDITIRSQQPTVLVITPRAAYQREDVYELRISGSDPVALADAQGIPIDGDGNGTPGGDFVLHFTVEMER